MQQIFLGILFLFLNVNLTLGRVALGLFPDFVGYILLLRGAAALSGQIARFSRMRSLCLGAAIYTGVLYVLDLTGLTAALGWGVYLAAIGEFALRIAASAQVVAGMEDAERAYGCGFAAAELRRAWVAAIATGAVSFLTMFFPARVLVFIGVIVSFVGGVLFLCALYRTKQAFLANDDRLHLQGTDGF